MQNEVHSRPPHLFISSLAGCYSPTFNSPYHKRQKQNPPVHSKERHRHFYSTTLPWEPFTMFLLTKSEVALSFNSFSTHMVPSVPWQLLCEPAEPCFPHIFSASEIKSPEGSSIPGSQEATATVPSAEQGQLSCTWKPTCFRDSWELVCPSNCH